MARIYAHQEIAVGCKEKNSNASVMSEIALTKLLEKETLPRLSKNPVRVLRCQ